MWHTAAYAQAIATGQTNVTLNALADNVFRIGSQNGFVLQEDMMLLMALADPLNGTGFRLNSPKFAQYGPIQIAPLQAAQKTADGILTASWPYRAPTFRNQEEVYATVDTGGTASGTEYLVASYSNGVDPYPAGEELIFKLTSTTAAVSGAWTLLTYTFGQTLPEGVYALLASEHFSTNSIAHRWTFWNQFYRPGFPSVNTQSERQWPGIRDYRMGLAGQFSNVTPPNLEVLCNGTDNSHTIFMRAIKVA